jgi:hypothetical protein
VGELYIYQIAKRHGRDLPCTRPDGKIMKDESKVPLLQEVRGTKPSRKNVYHLYIRDCTALSKGVACAWPPEARRLEAENDCIFHS